MALRPILDSLEGIPEAIQGEYKEYSGDDSSLQGKFVLDVEQADGWGLDNTTSLRNSLAQERQNRQAAVAKLQKLIDDEGNPLDIDDVISNLDRLKKFDSGDFQGSDGYKEAVEAIKSQLGEKHTREITAAHNERDQAKTTLNRYIVDKEAVEAISSAKGRVKALLPHVAGRLGVQFDDNGVPTVIVKGADGVPMISQKQNSDALMTAGEFVEMMKKDDDFKALFEGTSESGGGTGKPSPSTGGSGIDSSLPPEQKLAMARRQKAGR